MLSAEGAVRTLSVRVLSPQVRADVLSYRRPREDPDLLSGHALLSRGLRQRIHPAAGSRSEQTAKISQSAAISDQVTATQVRPQKRRLVNPPTAGLSPLSVRSLDLQEDGCAVDIHHFNSGAQSVLAYATVNGSLVGWDLRSNSNAWTLRHDLRLGLITSFAVDMHQCWLCLGSFNIQGLGRTCREEEFNKWHQTCKPFRPLQVPAVAPWPAGTCGSSSPSQTTPTLPEPESDGCRCIRSTSHLSSQVRVCPSHASVGAVELCDIICVCVCVCSCPGQQRSVDVGHGDGRS